MEQRLSLLLTIVYAFLSSEPSACLRCYDCNGPNHWSEDDPVSCTDFQAVLQFECDKAQQFCEATAEWPLTGSSMSSLEQRCTENTSLGGEPRCTREVVKGNRVRKTCRCNTDCCNSWGFLAMKENEYDTELPESSRSGCRTEEPKSEPTTTESAAGECSLCSVLICSLILINVGRFF